MAANASDDVGVVGVQFLLDGNPLGNEDTTSPYSMYWDTTTAANGTHTLTARARDVSRQCAPCQLQVTVTWPNNAGYRTSSVCASECGDTANQSIYGFASPYTSAQVAGTPIFSRSAGITRPPTSPRSSTRPATYQQAVPTAMGQRHQSGDLLCQEHKGGRRRNEYRDSHFNASTPFVDIRAPGVQRTRSGQSVRCRHLRFRHRHDRRTAARSPQPQPELIFGAGTTTGGFSAAGTNFVNRIITSPDGDIAEDRLVTTTGSYSATARLSRLCRLGHADGHVQSGLSYPCRPHCQLGRRDERVY